MLQSQIDGRKSFTTPLGEIRNYGHWDDVQGVLLSIEVERLWNMIGDYKISGEEKNKTILG